MNIKQTILGTALILASSGAFASNINVGGVVWDPSSLDDYFSTDTIYESLVVSPGDILGGYGKIVNISSETTSNVFCPGCELTYQFGGFTLSNILDINASNAPGSSGDEVVFTGGWVNFYVDHSADFAADNFASAGAGTSNENALWLSMVGHSQTATFGAFSATGTLFGAIASGVLGTGTEGGNGVGNLDVTGGLAYENFNTNTRANGSDFSLTSQFAPRICVNNNNCPSAYMLTGSNTLLSNSIPEPTSLALLGIGLLGFGANRSRKQA